MLLASVNVQQGCREYDSPAGIRREKEGEGVEMTGLGVTGPGVTGLAVTG
jgi:hypothetical protein